MTPLKEIDEGHSMKLDFPVWQDITYLPHLAVHHHGAPFYIPSLSSGGEDGGVVRVTVTLAHLLPRHPHQDLYSHLVYLPKCFLFFSHMRPPLSWVIDAGDEPLPIQRTVVTDTLSSKEWHMSNTYILTKTGKEQGGGGGILCLPQPPGIKSVYVKGFLSRNTYCGG